MKYYTNGLNEKRFNNYDAIPSGWKPGRLKSTVTTLGKVWCNNGEKELFVDSIECIPSGFAKGRLPKSEEWILKHKKAVVSKNYKHYNNGAEEILISDAEEVPEGFVKGRLPMTDSQKIKLSASHIGKHHTVDTKVKISMHSNNNREKAKITCKERYGCEHVFGSPEIRKKAEETKRANGTFNTSKPEALYYSTLCKKYGKSEVLRNYKSTLYPFRCDFYIKQCNLFIELNLHWTHGGRPYDPNNEECQKQLAIWEEKAKTSQFYRNAIQTWTVRDVEKQRVAKENNLNYITYYLYEDIDKTP